MLVTVHYMAQMKRAAGCSWEAAEVQDAATVRELLLALAERHGPSLRTLLLDETREPLKSLLFFVGEEHADTSRPLHHGDTLTILAPMAGG